MTDNEIERLKQAIIATVASPVIGSIEDYAWEAIFHYVKDIPLTDPALGRSKLLYDAVNIFTKTGWSLKSLQLSNLKIGSTFFFVIQRADIISKADKLGFPGLTEVSPPEELGAAVIQHWNEKLMTNQLLQGVENSYESILLKTIKGNEYVYCEYPLYPLDPTTFNWAWTVNKKTGKSGAGLQGSVGDKIELVWYKNQKQLFKARIIPPEAVRINIQRTRLNPENYVKTILAALQAQNS
nr:hypothetical protein [Anabaena catenula]